MVVILGQISPKSMHPTKDAAETPYVCRASTCWSPKLPLLAYRGLRPREPDCVIRESLRLMQNPRNN
jgi:hypothetical protein